MRGARLVAQAKINLFLRILAREESGFHSLETLFQRLDLGDLVTVRLDATGRSLDCQGAETGPTERNLAWRAAETYADATGWPKKFAIEVEKRIPVGGGLGGGSADAGAVLRLFDYLAPEPIGQSQLLQLAATLGADVPFLASTAPRALGWGRGERLLALPALDAIPVVLLIPPVSVATVDAFRWLSETRDGQDTDGGDRFPEARQLSVGILDDWPSLATIAGNDFEVPVAGQLPAVAELAGLRDGLRALSGGSSSPLYAMTGSGSTWFLLSASKQAIEAAERLGGELTGVELIRTHTSAHVVEPEPIE